MLASGEERILDLERGESAIPAGRSSRPIGRLGDGAELGSHDGLVLQS